MRFTQPPPNFGGGLGFGGSSGPGCGGGEFWDELSKFGIFPDSSMTLGNGSSALGNGNNGGNGGTSVRGFNYGQSSGKVKKNK